MSSLIEGLKRFLIKFREYEVRNIDEVSTLYLEKNKYVRALCKKRGENIVVILFADINPYTNSIVKLKSLLSTFRDSKTIILITKTLITKKISLIAKKFPDHKIFNYLHRNVRFDLTNAPFCSPHRIMSPDEVKVMLSMLHTTIYNLPRILIDDPQIIILGANVGDVIEIRPTELSGESIRYRVVYGESIHDAIEKSQQESEEQWQELYEEQGKEEKKEEES